MIFDLINEVGSYLGSAKCNVPFYLHAPIAVLLRGLAVHILIFSNILHRNSL